MVVGDVDDIIRSGLELHHREFQDFGGRNRSSFREETEHHHLAVRTLDNRLEAAGIGAVRDGNIGKLGLGRERKGLFKHILDAAAGLRRDKASVQSAVRIFPEGERPAERNSAERRQGNFRDGNAVRPGEPDAHQARKMLQPGIPVRQAAAVHKDGRRVEAALHIALDRREHDRIGARARPGRIHEVERRRKSVPENERSRCAAGVLLRQRKRAEAVQGDAVPCLPEGRILSSGLLSERRLGRGIRERHGDDSRSGRTLCHSRRSRGIPLLRTSRHQYYQQRNHGFN